MDTAWESDLANFLTDLSAVQDETLEILIRKRKMIATADLNGLAEIGKLEEVVIQRLQLCLQRRQELLDRAADEGLPSNSIRSLSSALPQQQRTQLTTQLQHSTNRARLLRHHSLTNWVLVQRTLLHLAQMVEIIATGGRMKPTYGKDEPVQAGVLVDHAG
jgi:hypothetical protein